MSTAPLMIEAGPGATVLPLVEHFFSVQGEGYNAGRAAFFIRFAGCNLDCVFGAGAVCDTPWRRAREKLMVSEVVGWILQTITEKQGDWRSAVEVPLVIITGGEPTLSPGFPDLVTVLKGYGLLVALETNGTRFVEEVLQLDWIVVSPKDRVQHARAVDPAVDPRYFDIAHEWRYVISGPDDPAPPVRAWRGFPEHCHTYVSPAFLADGSGNEHLGGAIPQFAHGAVERCIDIVQADPRIRISLQSHKFLRVR